jgi:hypothetical protein
VSAFDETLLNPGIRGAVRFLRALGWETCDSGDGETHAYACDREEAYVVIQLPPETLGSSLTCATERVWKQLGEPSATRIAVQCSWSPQDGMAFIDLSGPGLREVGR